MKNTDPRVYVEIKTTVRENWQRPKTRKKMIIVAVVLFLSSIFCGFINQYTTDPVVFSLFADSVIVGLVAFLGSCFIFNSIFTHRSLRIKSGDLVKVIRVDGSEEEFRA